MKTILRAMKNPLLSFVLLLTLPVLVQAQKPELTVQMGHTFPPDDLEFSPDGKILAAADQADLLLWDVATGVQLRKIYKGTLPKFSPDTKTIAFVPPGEAECKLFDLYTNAELRKLPGRCRAFSPDGKSIAISGTTDDRLFDVSSGAELHRLPGSFMGFSPDGQTLALDSKEELIIWNIASRHITHTNSPVIGSWRFSPDGKKFAAFTAEDTIRVWRVDTGVELFTISRPMAEKYKPLFFSPDGKFLAIEVKASDEYLAKPTTEIWDALSGKRVKSLVNAGSCKYNPDGKTLACIYEYKTDEGVRFYDAMSNEPLHSMDVENIWYRLSNFSSDGRFIAVNEGRGRGIHLIDASKRKIHLTLDNHSEEKRSLAFSDNGRYLATGSWSPREFKAGGLRLWDVTTGDLRTLRHSIFATEKVFFDSNGRALLHQSIPYYNAGRTRSELELVDTASGKPTDLLAEFNGPNIEFVEGDNVISPNGEFLVYESGRDRAKGTEIILYDIPRRKRVRTLEGRPVFSPDSRTMVMRASGELLLSEVETGKELKSFVRDGDPVALGQEGKLFLQNAARVELFDINSDSSLRSFEGHYRAISPDRKKIITGGDKSLSIWDTTSGAELRKFTVGDDDRPVAFSPDSRYAAIGADDGLALFNLSNGKERQLTGRRDDDNFKALTFSPDGGLLAGADWDTQIKLWDVSGGELVAALIELDRDDWVVVTPDGLFDGSPAGWKLLLWRFSPRLYDLAPVEAFFNEYYYPGLLAEIFTGKRPKAPQSIEQRDRRQPDVKLSAAIGQPSSAITSKSIQIKVEVAEVPKDENRRLGSGAKDVRVFRNGSLVKVWHGDVLNDKPGVTLEANIPIVAGENKLTAYAFNRDNVKSADATLTINGADSLRRKGTAYVVAVGVNKYAANPFFRNLKFAVADADEFASVTRQQQERLAKYEKAEVIKLTDDTATKAKVLGTLTELAKKVQPEDVVVVYFAGHGLAEAGRFYLIPHDIGVGVAARPNDNRTMLSTMLAANGISDLELQAAFEGVDAGQLTMVIDACNSGQALGGEKEGRGPMNSKGLAQLAYDKGMYILTASQSFQAAQEASQLGHGLLTYALVVEGLNETAADAEPKDGSIFVREWLNYATTRVPEMQINEMKRALSRGRNLTFREEERGLDMTKRSGQTPRVFYRRELEAQPVLIARPGASN